MTRYFSASEASERLGVSRNTLYAYVSRGLVRSERTADGSKTNRYNALDVERLATRSEVHKAPAKALRETTDWGAPILESAITLIADETFYYRGHCVPELAAGHSFEEILTLLWEAPNLVQIEPDPALQRAIDAVLVRSRGESPAEQFLSTLVMLNREDTRTYRFSQETTVAAGVMIIASFVRILTGVWPSGDISGELAKAWRLDECGRTLLDSALVLVADHELNISTFTARCTASAGCSPYAAVAAATHAFWGRRHGGNTERIRGLFDEAVGRGSLYEVIRSRLQRGDTVPGFGHRLYDADPRARFLLERLPASSSCQGQVRAALAQLPGLAHLTVDFALVLLEKELGLPERAGSNIFYLGRLAGLVAHIKEQYGENRPIRPRASYVGARP